MNDLNDILNFQFNYILNLVNIIMGHTLATWMAKTSCQILNCVNLPLLRQRLLFRFLGYTAVIRITDLPSLVPIRPR